MRRGTNKKPDSGKSVGSIRLISGQWRGRKLPVLDRDGLRPTTDRTKETLFNWLMNDIRDSRCLDLFAGSGSLGLEALSRYARHVTFVELDKGAADQIRNNLRALQVPTEQAEVIFADACQTVTRLQHSYDVIFLDPPFGKGLLNPVIEALSQSGLVHPGSLIYIEHEPGESLSTMPNHWTCIKDKATKGFCYRLFEVQEKV
ncbi:16S rRNA (guanine(966)-N(2))-methyltransferase RsmD [Aestuariibacter halophilus]|uniref:Ribosomal RNA small subunit methyltransferase D n=1 Tax=Fluctibacter halophilus TaxID=226011 RepID=A0ABS8G9P2_9ALTE|nr:16S rRNA (guanine(966)-N(2))-methyltransferase RsmD [Aestuariibacter halophilus]MCC2617164.1 16S rRNA (guanine(966)-N(2))-methyltransferase RsmD [Aestuariibacter halophilus]